jgi:hypothetical protein
MGFGTPFARLRVKRATSTLDGLNRDLVARDKELPD